MKISKSARYIIPAMIAAGAAWAMTSCGPLEEPFYLKDDFQNTRATTLDAMHDGGNQR